MRTLLRQIRTGVFFRERDFWTPNPDEAHDFRSVSHAIELVEQAGFQDMEVVFLSENPRRICTVRADAVRGLEDRAGRCSLGSLEEGARNSIEIPGE